MMCNDRFLDIFALESSGSNSIFQGFKFVWWWDTAPNEGDGEERDRFWNDMDRILDTVGNRYRLCILGNLNGWIGERTRAGITGAFGVSGENDNGRRGLEFYAERGLCMGNT